MRRKQGRRLKLMYLAGTQDPHDALHHLRLQQADPAALFVPYIRQFLELCDDLAADGVVVSNRRPGGKKKIERFVFYCVPNRRASGLAYDLGQVLYGLRVCLIAARERPSVVIANDGVMHLVTIPLLRLTGARVVLAFHNTLWTCFSTSKDRWETVARRGRAVFTMFVSAILSASSTIEENLVDVTGGRNKPILEFLPTYPELAFGPVVSRDSDSCFRILYAGRILREKGVFKVLCMAAAFRDAGYTDCLFTICGSGSLEAELNAAIQDARLEDTVRFVGQRAATELVDLYHESDVVVVPTTTDFREGFNQVVAETILAGRRVITSRVCPAARYFDDGVVLVRPDDVEEYITTLMAIYLGRDVEPDTEIPLAQEGNARFFNAEYGWKKMAERAVVLATTERGRR